MPSQTDLDQGGTFRQTQKVYLGSSIGWVWAPSATILDVTTGGTTIIQPGVSLVRVKFNGTVTLQLPLAKGNHAGAGAIPGSFITDQVTIAEVGGFGNAHNITILPAGAELIDGQVNASINSDYGVVTLVPNVTTGAWNQTQ